MGYSAWNKTTAEIAGRPDLERGALGSTATGTTFKRSTAVSSTRGFAASIDNLEEDLRGGSGRGMRS